MKPLKCPLCCEGTFDTHSALKEHIQMNLDNMSCPSCNVRCEIMELPKHLEQCVNNRDNARVSRKTMKQKSGSEFDNLLQVKIEGNGGVVTDENNTTETEDAADVTYSCDMIYSCEMCKMTFDSIEDHLNQYHQDEEVLVETIETEEEPEQQDYLPDHNTFDEPEENFQEEETDSQTSQCEKNKAFSIEKYISDNGRLWKLSQIENSKDLNKKQIIEIFNCQNCKLQFPNLTHFEKHQCQKLTDTDESKVAQKKKKEPRIQYQCAFCCSTYLTLPELQKHMKIHLTGDDSGTTQPKTITMSLHICTVCKTKFPTYKQLKLHSKVHDAIETEESPPFEDAEKQFQCEVCKRTYEKQYKEIHMKSHEDEDQFICVVCNKTLDSRESLVHHSKAHSTAKKFTCSYCKKSFINFLSLEKHINNECQPRSFVCSYCGRRFSRAHEKVKHERIHTGEKPHVCDICGKAFRVKYCLTLHMRTHTGVRPYTCHYCGKQFKSQSVCSHHLKTHFKDRNYKCPFCPKTFKTAVQLAGHKNCHTKPFSCTECSRPFSSLYAIKAHMLSHKKEHSLKFNCNLCGAEYGRSHALKDHLLEFHGYADDERALKEMEESETVEESGEDEAMVEETHVVQIDDGDEESYVVHYTVEANGSIDEDSHMETVEA
ncbi:unnamed protein product [Ceutorhynchus assimilis]|uniref:C2H2-type domain-containing protein n=1 Tax=Ceutorhynchus assimilis TaxID=467358 RepID=A0A9P0DKB4_9CUCU|nr:unnamed protein product [Ceutorhynchus assimilis]